MQFGFVTKDLVDCQRAKKLGFDGLELLAHPGWDLDPVTGTKADAEAIAGQFQDAGISLLAVAHYDERLKEGDAEAIAGLENAIRLCPILGTNLLTINAWTPPSASDDDQLAFLVKYMGPLIKIAEDVGVRIAIENCPHGEANYARCPRNWAKMFDALPSPAFGLEFDPSHLIWQGVDYVQALRDFSDRVIAFHAKDTEVHHDTMRTRGMVRNSWWRFRVPGLGDADWQALARILIDSRFDGPMIIEHEDPVLHGERIEEGLAFGLTHLKSVFSGGC